MSLAKLLALTRYGPLGASSRVRLHQFEPALRASGFSTTSAPLLSDAYVEGQYRGERAEAGFMAKAYARRLSTAWSARRFDIVWIEKEVFPFLPAWIESLALAGVPYVVDYDDATFHTYDCHPRLAVRAALGRKVDRVMSRAALVVAGNTYIAERARRAGAPRIEVLPSVIDLDRYGPVQPEPDGPFTVGWIGSPGSERLLTTFRPVAEWLAGQIDTRLVLVGASKSALPGIPHETWAWSEATEVNSLRQFHVGIMPLADTPWERGKCGFKLIQCMGAGRPVVASPVGVNTEIVADGETGFLAASTQDWIDRIGQLRASVSLRRDMGRAGRARVESTYSLAVAAPRLAGFLRSVA